MVVGYNEGRGGEVAVPEPLKMSNVPGWPLGARMKAKWGQGGEGHGLQR